MLLYVTELLEPPVAVAALVRLFTGMYPDVLHKLMIAGERLETLLALMGLDLVAGYHAGSDANADAETG